MLRESDHADNPRVVLVPSFACDTCGPDAPDRSAQVNRALGRTMPDGFCVIGADGAISEVNEALCTMTGFGPGDLIGCATPRPFWPEENLQALSDALIQALSGRQTTFEVIYKRCNGERFPAELTVGAVAEDGSAAEGFVCVMREVTVEARERDRLREAHRVARLVSWEYDPQSDRVTLSGSLTSLPGAHVAETATLERMLKTFSADHREPLREAVARVSAGDGATLLESELVRSAGDDVARPRNRPEVRWVETRMQSVVDATGRTTGVRGTSQDISARKLAEIAGLESEERLRQAQRLAEVGSFELDHTTGKVTWSPELYRLFGVNSDTFSHDLADMTSRLPDDDAAALHEIISAVLSDGCARELEHGYRRGGELRFAETRVEAGRPPGSVGRLRGTMQDVTDRRAAEREIRLQAHLLDAVDVAVIATDLDGTITHWNRGAERLYDQPREAVIGRASSSLAMSPEQAADAQAFIERVIEAGQAEREFDMLREDGSQRRVGFRSRVFRNRAGEPAGIVGVSADITEKLEYERNLRASRDYQRAITDSMAEGLYTLDGEGRLIYINRAAQAMLGWGSSDLLGRIMHDVVHARRHDGAASPADQCPLSGARHSGVSVRIADDVLIRKDGTDLPVEITSAPLRGEDGINGSIVVFTDATERRRAEQKQQSEVETLSWVGRVRDALAEERFVVFAQPIVDIATRSVVRHELLIRMLDSCAEIIAPNRFLPAAEKYGLVAEIDRWMLRQAVDLAARGNAVAVNLSAYSVGQPALLDEFHAALTRTGADPSLIVVELTETALIEDRAAAELLIEGIRDAGGKLAIDDFGTGYGGFTYLKRLPFDFLKIDAEFVRDLHENAASQHVVRAVVSLAQGFGQQTIAEGVEDDRSFDLLRELGVDFAQGFAIGRPAPATEVFGRIPIGGS